MHLLVGLGNPGAKYERTRHNIGFMAVDDLGRRGPAGGGSPSDWREKFRGLWLKTSAAGREVVLLKPQTFMNLSGECVQPAAAFFKVTPERVVVLHDELDLPFGEVRVKVGGGHAGHNGLRSLIERLGTPDFVRVRIGIGRPPAGFRGQVADYVLSPFEAVESATLPSLIERAAEAAEKVLALGATAAMNATNGGNTPTKPPKPPPV
jgi:PTH1 family peptidyl-tRNA hydrolase